MTACVINYIVASPHKPQVSAVTNGPACRATASCCRQSLMTTVIN